MKAESKLNLPLSVPDTVIAVLGYACLNYVQIPLGGTAEQETFKWLVSIAGGLLFCGFLAGRIWREFVSSRHKLEADAQRMRSHDRRIRSLEMERSAMRAMFVALLGRLDLDKTRLSEVSAELARYDYEEPTDNGDGTT
jgi:hypothetical protein